MTRCLVPIGVLVVVVAGLRQAGPAAAQPASLRLSVAAQALVKYAVTEAELPAGMRLTGPPAEVTNEEAAAADPDYAALVRRYRRITQLSQTASRADPAGSVGIGIILFEDAFGAWGHMLDTSTFPPDVEAQILPTDIEPGERSVLYHFLFGADRDRREIYALSFQRGRLALTVSIAGPPGTVSVEQILPVAWRIDAKVSAMPPAPPTVAEMALIEETTPTVVVRGAVRMLLDRFVEPLAVDTLLT
ncbi:MAG: hypothetical protein K6U89_19800, partial [Chloroflexi bacterium]|nr:hypothetical protein [Chloroflexota bacterium]